MLNHKWTEEKGNTSSRPQSLVKWFISAAQTKENKNSQAHLHLYLCPMDLLSNSFNDANHNVLQAFSLGVVVKNQIVPLLCVGAAERGSPHTRINGTQVVM